MNAGLLLFLGGEQPFDGWLRLSGGQVAARGEGLDGLPPLVDPDTAERLRIVAVAPGEDVALHWVELPAGLTPAQASGAARLMAAELAAQPAEELHVAAGADDGEGRRCVAIVPAGRMVDWLARCRAAGMEPDAMVPEPLLLLPQDGKLIRHDRGALPLFRGPAEAFSMEPELAVLACPGLEVEAIDAARFENELAAALDLRPVDLRSGPFARARKWALDRRLLRRLALLLAAILIVTAAIQLAAILRYTFAADQAEAEAQALAAAALPSGASATHAPGQLARRVAGGQAAGGGFGMLASPLFEAVRATPNAELGGLVFEAPAGLRATIVADTPATLSGLVERVKASGLAAEAGPLAAQNGRQSAELRVQTR